LIVVTTVAVVLPWAVRNWVQFHAFVPVASIVGADLSEGNNPCVAGEGLLVPYWAEGPCPEVNDELRTVLAATSFDARTPTAVRHDRALKEIAMRFIKEHPLTYVKLSLRRFWTTLLPYDPRGSQRGSERLALILYWLLVYPAGIIGMTVGLRARPEPGVQLLALLIALSVASIMAVLYWSDLRFRVGIDLFLACFAAWIYSQRFLVRGRATVREAQLSVQS